MKIVHITDLHFSSPLYVPEWGEYVRDFVNENDPDLLAVTGDLTMEGHLIEYQQAADFFASVKACNVLMVPGNHDSRNEGYTLFEEMFGERFPCFESSDVVVVGLDSSHPDSDDGHVGRENYHHIQERFRDDGRVRMIALHHHLIPIPGTGRERNIPQDAGDLLRVVAESGTHLVISGHKHKPWVWKLGDTHFITAGTACTRRLKGRSYPSFNVYTIEGKAVLVEEVRVDDGSVRELVRVGLS